MAATYTGLASWCQLLLFRVTLSFSGLIDSPVGNLYEIIIRIAEIN
jgi:hypothetical protein